MRTVVRAEFAFAGEFQGGEKFGFFRIFEVFFVEVLQFGFYGVRWDALLLQFGHDGALGFSLTAERRDHAAHVSGVIKQALVEEFVYQLIDKFGAFFVILILMKGAGFFDFAQHNGFEMAAAGGEALEIEQAGIAQVALRDFLWSFWLLFFVFSLFRLGIHGLKFVAWVLTLMFDFKKEIIDGFIRRSTRSKNYRS